MRSLVSAEFVMLLQPINPEIPCTSEEPSMPKLVTSSQSLKFIALLTLSLCALIAAPVQAQSAAKSFPVPTENPIRASSRLWRLISIACLAWSALVV